MIDCKIVLLLMTLTLGAYEMKIFSIKDCALIVRMGDQPPAMNLRELREGLARCDDQSLYHHFFETLLRSTFDDPEYRNDIAVWSRHNLHDITLAERIGLINPYVYSSINDLRTDVLDIIDERLHEVEYIPWVPRGFEFRFQRAVTVVFNTDLNIRKVEELPRAIYRMTTSSLYYHFLEARRRDPKGSDDFTAWLSLFDDEQSQKVITFLNHIDFNFMNLRELQHLLSQGISQTLKEGMLS